MYNAIMSTALKTLKNKPLTYFKLDGSPPFDDISGYGRTGTAVVTSSSTPTQYIFEDFEDGTNGADITQGVNTVLEPAGPAVFSNTHAHSPSLAMTTDTDADIYALTTWPVSASLYGSFWIYFHYTGAYGGTFGDNNAGSAFFGVLGKSDAPGTPPESMVGDTGTPLAMGFSAFEGLSVNWQTAPFGDTIYEVLVPPANLSSWVGQWIRVEWSISATLLTIKLTGPSVINWSMSDNIQGLNPWFARNSVVGPDTVNNSRPADWGGFQTWIDDIEIGNAPLTGGGEPLGTVIGLASGFKYSTVFGSSAQGEFDSPVFKQGYEKDQFALETWLYAVSKTTQAEQQVLGNFNQMDGLTINGTKISFVTKYLTSGEARCTYDLQLPRGVHVVGIHNSNKNELWVDGNMVASVELTDAQKEDSYVATSDKLYSGATTSTQQIALNGVAIYNTISPDGIVDNYLAGRDYVPQDEVVTGYGGESIDLSPANVYVKYVWDRKADFEEGRNNLVAYDHNITPSFVDGVSQASSWTVVAPIETGEYTSIHGVLVNWSGKNVTLQASLDGTNWVAVQRNKLLSNIPNGFNPQTASLQIRATFAGGRTDDEEWLESMTVIGYSSNTINPTGTRTITIPSAGVVNDNHEPMLLEEQNGVTLNGGTLTIAADATADATAERTIEIWVKVLSGTLSRSFTGATEYRNGLIYDAPPVGQWSVIHAVMAANVTTSITIGGDVIVGSVAVYPTAFSAADVTDIYASYTGYVNARATENSAVAMSENVSPVKIYAHNWSITGAGG